jgi:hypothetical protein
MTVDFYQTTWRYIPEAWTLHSQLSENLKFNLCVNVYFLS